mmetsp:Transcript_56778/g.177823  ORF Transcript_56778/g.177823 Transcript_56778/m.177823 type:complete len:284 (-) Transcript_56778:250-1101(-)
MPNIRPVMTKPPTTFTMETNTAIAARTCGPVLGRKPPPVSASPPTTVRPLMALVTDISGECSAAVTPATTWEPTRQARLSVVASAVTLPPRRPAVRRPAIPAAYARERRNEARKATLFGSTGASSGSAGAAGSGGGGGGLYSGSGRRSPSLIIQQPRTASSSSSKKKRPLGPMDIRNLARLLLKSSEAWQVADWTMSVPRIVMPFSVTTRSPATVPSQLPPLTAARSTTTLPRFIFSTMYFLMSLGAGFPGMSAVVITMSHSWHCWSKSAISASKNSLDISLA